MDSFETIYRRHASAVFRFAWGLCGDRSGAEDIVSETFVRILTKAPKIKTQTALAYLLAVARNTYLTGQRKRRREVPLTDEIPAPLQDPADRLDDQARLASVFKALGNLPEGERAALLLRVDHELPYEDIASALDISVGAAKVRVHRARMRLADALAGKDEQKGGHRETRSHS
ncbi:MAG: RNA polymerase sigma factor [Candidatus Eisenbacteria bacterium]|uniref:RNA polymerase sigma factor n=1 Tax=Eiseniibacteriota bacterium TaxID=2212470 RepID=A0A948W3A6_UNCEI|nr:RNA polymerase sigma factor [Candidatus Eisenbacteria bacterium]MBU1947680.1 RNA polymerase sigma factor [Candidatus Eisenbacteria bacterium]MBU2690877.1 RNA polymerase sigma factor [Candidatus Eisenbacteria bacterium]